MHKLMLLGLFAAACTAVDPGAGDETSAPAPGSTRVLHVLHANDGSVAPVPPPTEASQALLPPSATPLGTAFPGPGNRISYQGGPVLANPKAYVVFYGSWSARLSQVTLVENYLRGLGSTAYWAINGTYTDANHAVGPITFGGDYLDARTSPPEPFEVVNQAISAGHLPYDYTGIYIVVTSPEVDVSQLGSNICGWHTEAVVTPQLAPLHYGFVSEKTSGCSWPFPTANGAAVDGMISALTHELEESATDPNLDAYTDETDDGENADKCAWDSSDETRFQFLAPNGGKANMTVGGNNFFIQPNWVNGSGGYCGMAADRKRIAIQIPSTPGGSVSGSGVSCSGVECDFLYLTNSVLTYTVTPPSGFHLQSWTNCDSLSGNTCTLTLNTDRGILPNFSRNASCHVDTSCYNQCNLENCDDLPVRQRVQCQAVCRNSCTVCQ